MTQYGTWVAYAWPARITSRLGLLVAAAGVAYAARRLPLPARLPRPGLPATVGLVAAWAAAIVAFGACLAIYVGAERHDHIARAPPSDPITPVTILAAGAVFFIFLITSTGRPEPGWPARSSRR